MAVSRSVMLVPGVYVCISDDADRSAMVVPGVYVTALGVEAAPPTEYLTIFEDLVPSSAENADSPVSLGVLWASSEAGEVHGIRFYKGGTAGGSTHTVGLYDSGGSLIDSKVSSGETSSGWQEVLFTTPVAITALTDYTAVVYWPSAQYPFTAGFFSGGAYTNAPFVAANCRFEYGGSIAFTPASNSTTGNFYTDIMFVAEAAGGEDDLLANNVGSASAVTQPAVKQLHGLLANNVGSASSVGQPAAVIGRGLLANDVTSASSVTSPAVHQRQVLDAVNVTSASSVTSPAFAEIAPGVDGLLAEDITSGSYVSTPALVEIGGVVPEPPHTGIGGGPGYYGPSEGRRRYEADERRKRRQVAEAIDRAVARLTGEPEPQPVPAVAVSLVGPSAEELDARLQIVEGLDQRIVAADAELASLRDQAMALIEQARLDDDDEALELLLMVM